MNSPDLKPLATVQQVAQAICAQPDPEAALLSVIRLNLVNDEEGFAAELVRSYKVALASEGTIKELQDALADTLQELMTAPDRHLSRPCVQKGLRVLGRSAGISTFGNDWMDVLDKYPAATPAAPSFHSRPQFNEKRFLENLLLDEGREAYKVMTAEQRMVVRHAFSRGWIAGAYPEGEPT